MSTKVIMVVAAVSAILAGVQQVSAQSKQAKARGLDPGRAEEHSRVMKNSVQRGDYGAPTTREFVDPTYEEHKLVLPWKEKRENGRVGAYRVYSDQVLAQKVPLDPPLPDVVISSGWLYAAGDAPCVGTRAVAAQAEGCVLLLYYYEKPTGPNPKRCRVCFLEGNPGQVAWIFRRKQDDSEYEEKPYNFLSAGTFTEIKVDNNGRFVDWTDGGDEDHFRVAIDELPDQDTFWDTLEDAEEARHTDEASLAASRIAPATQNELDLRDDIPGRVLRPILTERLEDESRFDDRVRKQQGYDKKVTRIGTGKVRRFKFEPETGAVGPKGIYKTISRDGYKDGADKLLERETHSRRARKPTDIPAADAVIASGWMYASGDAPCVGTGAVVAQGEGCRMLLYYTPLTETAPGNLQTCRVAYLEGNPGQVVWVYRITPDNTVDVRFLSPGTYVDVEVNGDGTFRQWTVRSEHYRKQLDLLQIGDPFWTALGFAELERFNSEID